MSHQSSPSDLSFIETMFWFYIGMLISLFFPLLIRTLLSLRKKRGLEGKSEEPSLSFAQRFHVAWQQYGGKDYMLILVITALIAAVLVFMFGLQFYTARDAAIAGIGWESLSNKLIGRQKGGVAPSHKEEGDAPISS